MKKSDLTNAKLPKLWHGADYNPDQWLDYPGVFEEDIRLMKLAKCNVVSLGIFSWSMLEPEENVYRFEWMDHIIDKLYENGIYTILATPSAAKPAWLAAKYPEVLRVDSERRRQLYGERHNHCYSSPVYREKITNINTLLAKRYANHPGIVLWHISNELSGDCHCPLCQEEFRKWLKQRYVTLERLNHEWWNKFWSHEYTDWSQIESPSPLSNNAYQGLELDWKRFVTQRTIDFLNVEKEPLKLYTPHIPVTTNFMGLYDGLDYFKIAQELDVISWDSYPQWHFGQKSENPDAFYEWNPGDDVRLGAHISMLHTLYRSLLNKPFLLMESTPSMTNWQSISKLKKPHMHYLSSMQAIAHGSDSVQYFQWRKSRGGFEKLHGAVVDHCGHEHTRVFREVQALGEDLEKLHQVAGSTIQTEVAILFDWENRWALEGSMGPRNAGMKYVDTVLNQYIPFWKKGISVDIIDQSYDLSKYKLVITPMMYMVREGVAEKIDAFVKAGGTLVTTCWSGIVNESDLCFLDGFPGPLKDTLGIWAEEIDALADAQSNTIEWLPDNELNLTGKHTVKYLCELIHTREAKVLARYCEDFYKGMPAITVNERGKGKAYYIATTTGVDCNRVLYNKLIDELNLEQAIQCELPQGVTATKRESDQGTFIFIMNFNEHSVEVEVDTKLYKEACVEEAINDKLILGAYGVKVLEAIK